MHDLAGTNVGQVAADLGVNSGGLPDGQADSVTVSAGGGADNVAVTGGPTGIIVSGLAAGHSVLGPDPIDRLTVDGQAGADTFNASGLAANTLSLTLRGGPDADSLTGSPGDDTFASGDGDGPDLVEGGAGTDTASVTGSDLPENFAVAPAGARVLLTSGVVTLVDMDDVEAANIAPRGGADLVTVPDMAGTDLTQAGVDQGGADGQLDNVLVDGTAGADDITVTPQGSAASVGGLGVKTTVTTGEPDTDSLTIRGLATADVIDASALPAGVIGLTLEGGLGAEIFIGSQGKDRITGGDGDDTALMGAGDDTFVWNPGDDNDIVEGQSGSDRLLFNGANIAENIDISPNGTRMRFFRNIANVTMDCNDVEIVDFNALGGADLINVNDLSGTDLSQVNLALAAAGGAGDAAADAVILNGSAGNDVVSLSGGPAGVNVTGLMPSLAITGAEPANDRLTVNGLAGNDTINASGVTTGAILLTLNGDANDDTLTGGDGDDTINGGADNDLIHGGPGTDTLDGGGQGGDQVFDD